ncbi:MAG: methyltransferase domain-containing protein [Ruminococcaceae bacterium]|nr:methyltransferase domain-containing protein [Oscillospiraceae bacterium]
MSVTYERLSDEIEIAVSSDHTFGTDAVILAYFARPKRKDRCLDMGTGCGIIPFLWLRDAGQSPVHCLDIQENAIAQVKASIAHNSLGDRMTPHLCDLREIEKEFSAECFTLVTMNPPYKPMNTGFESLGESARIARHEVCCNIEDAVKAANYLLNYAGRFCMCHRPERLVDALTLMRQYKLEPKRLRFVMDREGEEPFLFLVEGKKGAKPFLRVEPPLVIKGADSRFTQEMLAVYGSYADGYEDKIR